MPTSYEVSQMFAQQGQAFSAQAQYAQNMSVMNRVGMGGQGVGGYGFGYAPAMGPGFNYGAQRQPYGAGNAVAAGVMSSGAMGANLASMGIGMASSFGLIPGGLPVAALAYGATQAVGAVAAGGQQQAQVNTMLGNQYHHFNPMSRSGAGFSRDDAQMIGNMARQMGHLPEMMSSFDEMTQIMSRMKTAGVMNGVRSASDFANRFRESISTIKEMSKVLGTTMMEAEQFFEQSRGAGFYGKGAQLKNAMNAQYTSAVTGASVGQVMSAQQQGAGMAMQYGARRGLGATAVTNMAQSIGLAQQSGLLREGAIEDVTGMGGPEGSLALAQRMYGGMMNFSNTAAGRLAMAGMVKFEGGKAVGLDEEMVRRFKSGDISIEDLKRRGGSLTNAEKISWTNRKEDLASSMAGQLGIGGAYQLMSMAMGDRYGTDEDKNLVMRRLTNMSAGEIDIAQGMSKASDNGESRMFAGMRQRQSDRRESSSPSAIIERVKRRLSQSTVGKLEQVGADIHKSIASSVDEFFDDMLGREVSTLTEERAKTIARAFSGSNSSETKSLIASMSGLKGGSSRFGSGQLSVGATAALSAAGPLGSAAAGAYNLAKTFGGQEGYIQRGLASISGQQTAGQESESIARLLRTGDASKQSEIAAKLRSGNVAGTGAEGFLMDILKDNEGFNEKTDTQKTEVLRDGLKSAVTKVAGKLEQGARDPKTLAAMDDNSFKYYTRNLSEKEKALLSSYRAASRDSVGSDPYVQMAAASGAGKIVGGMSSQSLTSLTKQAGDQFKAAQKKLGALGINGLEGYLTSGGPNAGKTVSALLGNQKAMFMLSNGDTSGALAELGDSGKGLTEKDLSGAAELVKGIGGVDSKRRAEIEDALKDYSGSAMTNAAVEFRKNMKGGGDALMKNADAAGKAKDAQRRVAGLLLKMGDEGDDDKRTNRDAYQKAFSEYADSLKGMSGEELERAMQAGGEYASAAMSSFRKHKKKKFSNYDEIEKEFGVSATDASKIVGDSLGKELTAGQIEALGKKGAGERAMVAAGSGAKPEQTEKQQTMELLKTMNQNQKEIATIVADMKKPLFSFGSSTTEGSSKDPKTGKAVPGKQPDSQ